MVTRRNLKRCVFKITKAKLSDSDGTIFSRIIKKIDKHGNIREHAYWIAEFTIGYDEKGKRIKKTICGKSKKEVAAKKREFLTKRDTGQLPMPDDALMKSYLYNFLHKHKKLEVQRTAFDKYETLANTKTDY